ncbi:MAG TPA: disulfide bond formation protein B [Allosphingosinicella sp.]|uniref:disulfide bond formation protein B n=1 Tax=Allosphingosinicella sp. TaxID=2823234 RepID=UPI002ED8EFA9
MTSLQQARWLALLVPTALLAGAYGSQYLGGLHPCEMCYWQRWPHFAAIGFALLSFALRSAADRGRSFVWLAALSIIASGAIGTYHAGVERGIFEGLTRCTSAAGSSIQDILAAPLVRCDQIPFEFLGISMAGWNAILSIGLGLVIAWLSLKKPKATA